MNVRSLVTRGLAVALAASVIVPTALSSTASAGTFALQLQVSANGKNIPVPLSCATTTTGSGSVVDTAQVNAFIAGVAGQVNVSAVNASYSSYNTTKRNHGLRIIHSKPGYALTQVASANLLCSAVSAVTTGTTGPPTTVSLLGTPIKPSKLDSQLGQIIVERLSKRRFWLYKNGQLQKTYRNAIGQPAWPTPTGNFHIGKKVKNPSWRNGYAAWSMNMPAYIGPSPNNPLGTRAIYVYDSHDKDTGVRFHGVPHSEDWSIGKAASHGCLRMHRKDVEQFFPLVKVGVPVYIIK